MLELTDKFIDSLDNKKNKENQTHKINLNKPIGMDF